MAALTDADKTYIRAAYTRQESHRDIAAHLGAAKTTVGAFMKREGLLYDSSKQQAAITKNVLTAQERISALRLDVIGIAEHEAQEIRQAQTGAKKWKTVLKETGGAERVHTLDFIPPQDKRANANSLGSHAATIARLAPKETENNDAAKSMIDRVIDGLRMEQEVTLGRETPDQSETA